MSKTDRRKAETALQAALVAADVLGILVAMVLAYGVRFHSPFTQLVPVTLGVPPLGLYLGAGIATAVVWVPLFAALGLYRPRIRLDYPSQFDLALRGIALGVVVALAMTFFYRTTTFSRLVLPMAGVLAVLLIPAFRVWIGRWLARRLPRSGVGVVGSGPGALTLAARLVRQQAPGMHCVGLFCDQPPGANLPEPVAALRAGTIDDAVRAARAGTLDRVLIALDLEEVPRVPGLIAAFLDAEIEVEWVPLVPELSAGRLRLESVDGLPVITLGEFPLLGWNGVLKRTMDLSLSLFGLILLAPLLAILALIVRYTSSGPVIYRQERVGRDGRRFQMLKFRSMRRDAEVASGPVRTQRGDPRTTAVGRFLRRTSLDELPQLWNVLKGEMSLVGPRPERPELIGDLVRDIPDYLRRHRVKAGMTGWAQVHGLRGADSSMEERILCDLFYIENWSVWLDLRILVRTVLGMFREPNAF